MAPKKPQLTKRRKPKPTNSAYAEFGYRLQSSKARTGKLSQKAQLFAVLCLCREKRCFFWQNLVAKVLWHIKIRFLPNAVSQSLRIQLALNSETDCRFQIRKHSIGGPGVLWHLKSPNFPKAVSQRPRIQLTLNSLIRTPVLLAALAHKNSLLTKSPEPKPTNSAYAEFANQNAGS